MDTRKEICEIISTMLDNPDRVGIYPTSTAYTALELLVQERVMQVAGFVWTEACCLLDEGEDPRTHEIPALIEKVVAEFK